MHKQDRLRLQRRRESELKLPDRYIIKGDSLFEIARKFGWAVNDPNMGNRQHRRSEMKGAIKEEKKLCGE
jgi:LysM repeat protein